MSALIASVIFIFGTILYRSEKRLLIHQASASQEDAITSLANVTTESLLSQDDLILLNYTYNLPKLHPEIEFAYVSDGRILLSHTDKNLVRVPASSLVPPGPGIKLLTKAVETKNRENITVTLGFSAEKINAYIKNVLHASLVKIARAAALAALLGLAAAFWLSASLAKPIKNLVAAAREISGGNLNFQIKQQSRDELGFLAEEFNRMANRLRELDEMKKDFVSAVTHELKSPLSALESYLDLMQHDLKTSKLPPMTKLMQDISYMKQNTSRLFNFVSDLLTAAKIEKGKFEIKKHPVKVEVLASEVILLLAEKAKQFGVKLSMPALGALPRLADADAERVRQVLINLLTNAIKYTPDGGDVSVSISNPGPETNQIVVCVKDSGIGIPKDSLQKIFEKFEQVKNARTLSHGPKGTGLGLYIAKSIVEAHGGKIWAESSPGKGSSFYFTLPAAA